MKHILITGATGNIGTEVIEWLFQMPRQDNVVAGVRNIEQARLVFKRFPQLKYIHFDFEDFQTFDNALDGIDCVFLLRPPHIADIEQYFDPLILKMKEKNIKELVFLSVQGAEKSKVIPHNKIELRIKKSGLDYIFLRPSYFMQNLTTTLIGDIRNKRKIILPAGRAKFNWIDVRNIAEIAALLIDRFSEFTNQAIVLTGQENENFDIVVSLINKEIPDTVTYENVNLLRFYGIKKKEGMPRGMIIVMILLHFLPRFQKAPIISNAYEKITGKKPTNLDQFISREKALFMPLDKKQ